MVSGPVSSENGCKVFSGIEYGFRANNGSVFFVSISNEREKIEIYEFEMHLNKFFVYALI